MPRRQPPIAPKKLPIKLTEVGRRKLIEAYKKNWPREAEQTFKPSEEDFVRMFVDLIERTNLGLVVTKLDEWNFARDVSKKINSLINIWKGRGPPGKRVEIHFDNALRDVTSEKIRGRFFLEDLLVRWHELLDSDPKPSAQKLTRTVYRDTLLLSIAWIMSNCGYQVVATKTGLLKRLCQIILQDIADQSNLVELNKSDRALLKKRFAFPQDEYGWHHLLEKTVEAHKRTDIILSYKRQGMNHSILFPIDVAPKGKLKVPSAPRQKKK
jgi:hypothetical protein